MKPETLQTIDINTLIQLFSSEDITNIRLAWQLAQGQKLNLEKIVNVSQKITEALQKEIYWQYGYEYLSSQKEKQLSPYLLQVNGEEIPIEVVFLEFPHLLPWFPWNDEISWHYKLLYYKFPTHNIFNQANIEYKQIKSSSYEHILKQLTNNHIQYTEWILLGETKDFAELVVLCQNTGKIPLLQFLIESYNAKSVQNWDLLFEKLVHQVGKEYIIIHKRYDEFVGSHNDDEFWVVMAKKY